MGEAMSTMNLSKRAVTDTGKAWRPHSGNNLGSFDERLTRREAEVAGLVLQGLANKAVAGQLGVQEGTVKLHLHNIYRKLRVSNRTGLMLSAIVHRR